MAAIRGLAERRARDLDQEVRDTKVDLAKLDAAQRLSLVINDASASGFDHYRGLLGRVHTALRNLSDSARDAFDEWDKAGATGRPPLERVILYIDDLDRCSPRKVVDVLAAVHLLLALPLFVVVVAVDPRWLRRCLEQYHSELFGGTSDGVDGATPLDYLDKIFQVVFALRPMGNEGDRFIEATLVPTKPAARRELCAPTRGPASNREGQGTSGPTNGTVGIMPPPEEPAMPQPEQLQLRTEEVLFLRRLRPLLDTPRAVKRLVNLYRLVRVGVGYDEIDAFIAEDQYQAVLVLLAVLVSAPDTGRAFIEELRDREGGLITLIGELASADHENDVWTRLLNVVREGDSIQDNLSFYRSWAGTIARFSFETWDLTLIPPIKFR